MDGVILVITNTDGSVHEYQFADIIDFENNTYAVLSNCGGLRIMKAVDVETADFRDVSPDIAEKIVEIYKEHRKEGIF